MEIKIIKADMRYLDDCAEILRDSELGMRYFVNRKQEYVGKKLITESFEKKEMYVALDKEGTCVGFTWIALSGIFHWFPYLHIIAVKADMRGKGIGKQLMAFFEEVSFVQEDCPKAFLVVGDFNTDAIALYKKLGYVQVGEIPGLYVPEISELLMMKERPEPQQPSL